MKIKVIKRDDVPAFIEAQNRKPEPKPRKLRKADVADFLFDGRDVKRLRVERENQWFDQLAKLTSGGFDLGGAR